MTDLRVWIALVCPVLAGCFSTAEDEISVSLELEAEEVRDLPVLASGATSLLGLDVPDSHGELAVRVNIEGASSVAFRGLELQVQVDGAPLEVRMVRQRTPREDLQAGLTATRIQDGDVLRFHVRARSLNDLALPQGVPYGADLALSWDEDTIETVRETGTAALQVSDFVAAAVDSGTFELLAQPREALEPDATEGAQFRAAAEVSSGLTVEVVAASARVVYFGPEAAVPGIGLALVDAPALQVGGAPAGAVAPDDVLDIYSSSAPAESPAPYTAGGTAAAVGSVASGKALVTLELDYEHTDGTPGVTTQALAFITDLP